MARLGYSQPSLDCVSSSPAETVEEGIERGLRLLETDETVTEVWVRDDLFRIVWRRSRDVV
jgi:hypothetical protein